MGYRFLHQDNVTGQHNQHSTKLYKRRVNLPFSCDELQFLYTKQTRKTIKGKQEPGPLRKHPCLMTYHQLMFTFADEKFLFFKILFKRS